MKNSTNDHDHDHLIQERGERALSIKQFWPLFLEVLDEEGVPAHCRKWYIFRVERWIESDPARPSKRSPEAVIAYVQQQRSAGFLAAWQLAQLADALRLLYLKAFRVSWADDFDWHSLANMDTGDESTGKHSVSLPEWEEGPDYEKLNLRGRQNAHLNKLSGIAKSSAFYGVMKEQVERARIVAREDGKQLETERAYIQWIRRFAAWAWKTRSTLLTEVQPGEVERYLKYLASDLLVAPSTQKQALCALLFLFSRVWKRELGILDLTKAPHRKKVRTVLWKPELKALFAVLEEPWLLPARLMYGTGARVSECIRLRVRDLDFAGNRILLRDTKGKRQRIVPLPKKIAAALEEQLAMAKQWWEEDLAKGYGEVWMSTDIKNKYGGQARDWEWQWVFPMDKLSVDPRSGKVYRHHLLRSSVRNKVTAAGKRAGLTKRITPHVFRHSFATHLLQSGTDIYTLRDLMGHADISTTMEYLHLAEMGAKAKSPLDSLEEEGDD